MSIKLFVFSAGRHAGNAHQSLLMGAMPTEMMQQMFAERMCMRAQSLSHVGLCDPTDCIAWREFFRQEYWSGLPFPPPGPCPLKWCTKCFLNEQMNPNRPVLLAYCGADQIPSLSYGFDTSNCWDAAGSQSLWVLSGEESCFEQGHSPSLGQLHPKTAWARGRSPGSLIQTGQHWEANL